MVIVTFAPAFHPYRYMHRSFLDGCNLCSCFQFTCNTLLSNGQVGGGVHVLTGSMLVAVERSSATI